MSGSEQKMCGRSRVCPIAEALDLLESFIVLQEPDSQTREIGDAALREARSALVGTRAQLLQEISFRADSLRGSTGSDGAIGMLSEAARASQRDPLSGGRRSMGTSSMLRRCALDCAAYALLALEKLSEGG